MKRKLLIIGVCAIALIMLGIAMQLIFVPEASQIASEPTYKNPDIIEPAGGVYIYDIEEYYEFISTAKNLPKDFVTVDMVSGFGDFYAFISNYDNLLPVYFYILTDKSGAKINFSISVENKLQTREILDISKAGTSLYKLATQDTGIILRDGVEYRYSVGRLTSIKWVTNNHVFWVSFNYPHKEYTDLPTDSLLSRMLSLSDADLASALNELSAIVSQNDHVTE